MFVGDVLSIPLRSGLFDVCLCIAVIHHLATEVSFQFHFSYKRKPVLTKAIQCSFFVIQFGAEIGPRIPKGIYFPSGCLKIPNWKTQKMYVSIGWNVRE